MQAWVGSLTVENGPRRSTTPGSTPSTPAGGARRGLSAVHAVGGLAGQAAQHRLGSWAELKHDTILYAKQVYAELGGGGTARPSPKLAQGYVEPVPAFTPGWRR
jgi:hypothetical protein